MSHHEKESMEGNKKMNKPKQRVIHNPIPTSFLLSRSPNNKSCVVSLPSSYICISKATVLSIYQSVGRRSM